MQKHPIKLLVLDIDNTVFDWVTYYVHCMDSLFTRVGSLTGIPKADLAAEAKKVFEAQGSIEYPFLIQELPSVCRYYGEDIHRMLDEAVNQGREAFNQTSASWLQPYQGVLDTFADLKANQSRLPIVALTDAPRYVAMWKLNKLGILHYFDSVYGLSDPKIPSDEHTKKPKVDPEILYKHLQQNAFGFSGRVRTLPEEYEKPGVRGLRTVLMDYDMDDLASDVVWVGDNLRKDIGLGRKLGVVSVWARYGTLLDPEIKDKLLQFSPSQNVHKNVALDPKGEDSPQPSFVLNSFSELLHLLPSR